MSSSQELIDENEENLNIHEFLVSNNIEVKASVHVLTFIDYLSVKNMYRSRKQVILHPKHSFDIQFIKSKFIYRA